MSESYQANHDPSVDFNVIVGGCVLASEEKWRELTLAQSIWRHSSNTRRKGKTYNCEDLWRHAFTLSDCSKNPQLPCTLFTDVEVVPRHGGRCPVYGERTRHISKEDWAPSAFAAHHKAGATVPCWHAARNADMSGYTCDGGACAKVIDPALEVQLELASLEHWVGTGKAMLKWGCLTIVGGIVLYFVLNYMPGISMV